MKLREVGQILFFQADYDEIELQKNQLWRHGHYVTEKPNKIFPFCPPPPPPPKNSCYPPAVYVIVKYARHAFLASHLLKISLDKNNSTRTLLEMQYQMTSSFQCQNYVCFSTWSTSKFIEQEIDFSASIDTRYRRLAFSVFKISNNRAVPSQNDVIT